MKRVLLIALGVVVFVAAAALIAPSFIDWNKYKGEIAGPIERATGRSLAMNGDLSLTILPTPRLSASDVRLSVAGGTHDFLTLRSLEVQIALWPLLRGEIQVTSVRLVEPEVFLEVAEDGTPNWTFGASSSESAPATNPGQAAAISVERVVVANGVVNFAGKDGRRERVDSITATLTASNLAEGPFAAEGRFSLRDQAIGFDVAVGALTASAPSLRGKLELERGGAVATIQGTFTGLSKTPTLDAKFGFEGSDLREALSTLARLAGRDISLVVPGAQSFAINAAVSGTPEGVSLNDVSLVVGETRATGAASVVLGAPLEVDATLSLGRLDLDAWANAVAIETSGAAAAKSQAGVAPQLSNPLTSLDGVRATLTLTGEALTYRGGLIRQLRVVANAAEGAIDLTALNAMLPGGSDVSLSGRMTTVDGQPRFDGTVELASSDFRAAADWLGLSLDGIAEARLRQVSFQSRLRATKDLGQAFGIDLRLDSSRITGGVAYAFRARPSFSIDLEIDRLNLDAYLADGGGPADQPVRGVPALGTGALAILGTFDTNAKVAVESLTVGGRRYGGVKLDAGLLAGDLTVRNAAIGDAGGAAISVSGSAGAFASVPAFDAKVTVKARDVAAPARFFGVDLPVDARALGQIDLNGTVIGTAEDLAVDIKAGIGTMATAVKGRVELFAAAPRIDLRVQLDGPSFVRAAELGGLTLTPVDRTLDGPLSVVAIVRGSREMFNFDTDLTVAELKVIAGGTLNNPFGDAAFNMSVQANHPNAERLLRTFGADYQPAATNLGGLRLLADIAGAPARFAVSRVEGGIGPVNFVGDAQVDLSGSRSRIDARLNTSEILVDLFLPRPVQSAGTGNARGAQPPGARGGARWSQEPIDLSALSAVDGRFELRPRGLTYGDYAFAEPVLLATLENGTLRVDPLGGGLFDGNATIKMTVNSDRPVKIDLSLSLDGANIEQALTAGANLDRVTGRFDMSGTLTTVGQSQFDWVNNLAGRVSFSAREGVVRGVDLRALSGRLGRLNEALDFADLMLRTLQGGETAYDSISGTFAIKEGVARSDDLTAALDAAAGSGTAVVDLARWRLDMRTSARLTDHPQSPDIGLDLSGPLDAPQRNVRTQALEQYLAQRLGSTLIRKLLKDDSSPSSPATAAPANDSRAPALPGSGGDGAEGEKPATGNDLLRGIIRRLGDR